MMTLVKLLPLMVGNLIDDNDDHWICFLILWDICGMVLKFEVTEADSRHLSWLVEVYLESFHELYGHASMPPKFHYLVHLSQQIMMYVVETSTYCILNVYCMYAHIGLVHYDTNGA